MVIDNNKADLETIRELLSPLPELQVLGCFLNLYSALGAMVLQAPDLLIASVELPGANGLDLAAYLLKASPTTRVVLASGSPYYAVSAFYVGARGFLKKPYRADELRNALKPFLPNHQGFLTS